jgi:hypothetical protein
MASQRVAQERKITLDAVDSRLQDCFSLLVGETVGSRKVLRQANRAFIRKVVWVGVNTVKGTGGRVVGLNERSFSMVFQCGFISVVVNLVGSLDTHQTGAYGPPPIAGGAFLRLC